MPSRRVVIFATAAAVTVGVFAFWPRGPREPVYNGEPLSVWLSGWPSYASFGYDGASPGQRRAEKVMRELGTNALPWLLSEFSRSPSRWKTVFNRWVPSRFRFRLDEGQMRSQLAGRGLENMGPGITPALPELAGYLDDSQRANVAARAMAQAGEIAIPYFTRKLSSTNPVGHFAAVVGLGELMRGTSTAGPLLVQGLQSPNRHARMLTIQFLGNLSNRPDIAMPALSNALADSDANVRALAKVMLARFSTNVPPSQRPTAR